MAVLFVRPTEKYRLQFASFQEIPFSADVGIVLVDSKAMRMKLLPSPSRCLAAIQQTLPVLMRKLSETLLDDIVKRLAVLASHPTDVEPFVQKVGMIEVRPAAVCLMKLFSIVCSHSTDDAAVFFGVTRAR
jgi:hypothetical protein